MRTTSTWGIASRSRRPTASAGSKWSDCSGSPAGSSSGRGFASMALGSVRSILDKPRAYDEVRRDHHGGGRRSPTSSAGSTAVRQGRPGGDAGHQVGRHRVPASGGQPILYFFAAMALFVGGFLIFNASNDRAPAHARDRDVADARYSSGPDHGSVLRGRRCWAWWARCSGSGSASASPTLAESCGRSTSRSGGSCSRGGRRSRPSRRGS